MMHNKHQQQKSKDLPDGQGAHRWDVTNQTVEPKKERKKKTKGEKREGKDKEKRWEKGRDEREGMMGYLETPPSLAAVPNSVMLLASFASLGFVSLLIFFVFSLCFLSLFFTVFDWSSDFSTHFRSPWIAFSFMCPPPSSLEPCVVIA